MCNCYAESEQRLRDHVAEQLPPGSVDLSVELGGYVFGLGGPGGISHRAACPVEISYKTPKKGGAGMKPVKQKSFLRATFCPFCGERYEPAKAEENQP